LLPFPPATTPLILHPQTLTDGAGGGCRRFRDRTNGSIAINDMTSSLSSSSSSAAAAAAGVGGGGGGGGVRQRKVYIKKPLNAFMLFMKEMRQKVIDECTLKESAAINQILGRKVIIIVIIHNNKTKIKIN